MSPSETGLNRQQIRRSLSSSLLLVKLNPSHMEEPPDPSSSRIISEFVFGIHLPWFVHTEERGRQAMDVSFSLHEGGEGGDAVPNEVVGLS